MFNKKKRQDPEIGMVVSEQGISVVSEETPGKASESKHFPKEDWSGVASWVQQHKLESKKVHLVLDNKQYQLNQIEPPSVPEEEINSALLYSLRDRLDYKMTEVQIDHFSLPEDANRGGHRKVNVVTAHSPTLKKVISGMEIAGLEPAVIDIAELAILNLMLDRVAIGKGICFLAYHENFVVFMIYKNAELYLTRSVVINSWQDCISDDSNLAREGLLLEIQRTLDYYQSQLGQPPVAELIIPDWSRPLSPLINYLADNLAIEVGKISCRKEDQAIAESSELRQLMLARAALIKLNIKQAEGSMEKNHAKG